MATLQGRDIRDYNSDYSPAFDRYGKWILIGVLLLLFAIFLVGGVFGCVIKAQERKQRKQVQSYPQDFSQQEQSYPLDFSQQEQSYPQDYSQQYNNQGPEPHYDNYPAESGYNANYDNNQHQASNYQHNSESRTDYHPNKGGDNFQPPPGPPPASYQRN